MHGRCENISEWSFARKMGILFGKKKGSEFDEDTFVIVGLGNPGAEYAKTRHNMGFRALDVLASDEQIEIKRAKFHALIGQGRIAGHKVILVKPQTYMNRSGIAVREAAMYYNVPSSNVIVIYDDIDLPVTAIRVRKSGGPGTHNGMKSVVEQLGVKDFPRIRIGVGSQDTGEDLVDRVIGKVPKSEQELLDRSAEAAAKAAAEIVRSGIEIAMNRHNYDPEAERKKKEKEEKRLAEKARRESAKAAELEKEKEAAKAAELGAEAAVKAAELGQKEAVSVDEAAQAVKSGKEVTLTEE